MNNYEYGDFTASTVLIQMVDDHDLSVIKNEVRTIQTLTDEPFHLIALKVNSWNNDLSPWSAPAVFGDEGFGDGAADTLAEVLTLCKDEKQYFIGGYSLAGLFALWAAYQTDVFEGVAAASPSVWFPGFLPYMKENEIKARKVYISLGDREEKTRNPVMATVGDCIREADVWLREHGVDSALEWNKGNHFKEPDVRTAKGFAWVLGGE